MKFKSGRCASACILKRRRGCGGYDPCAAQLGNVQYLRRVRKGKGYVCDFLLFCETSR